VGKAPDVVVLGSGAAGLSAALGAAAAGAEVLVVERSHFAGGTTALSGGIVWAPGNHLMAANGLGDSEADALGYIDRIDRGGDPLLTIEYVRDAPRVMKLLEDLSPLRWKMLEGWPDYHSEEAGSREGGRSLWPAPLELPGRVADRIQPSPEDSPERGGDDTSDEPANDGVVLKGPVRGRVLVGGLLSALESSGVEVRLGARAKNLVYDRDNRRVTGIDIEGETIRARVVIATGGFQHDQGLAASFLRAPEIAPMGTPGCSGDGLRMAISVGAALGNMAEGWWMPAMQVAGEELDGSPFFRPLHSERALPGALMVDRTGRRFVNEAQNYGDVGRAMQRFTPEADWFPALASWLVFDAAYRRRNSIGPLQTDDPDPDWLARSATLGGLASSIGLEERALVSTVERFNSNAAIGVDPDFKRGERYYDRWIGDPGARHPTLGALTESPFYALQVHCGCMGTKGGPRTDGQGRVIDIGGEVITGLYAAGNAAANPFGIATPAGGATLGPALVFGTRAGESSARDK
jgi:3-oxosteroid 1-dehydrogenase